MIQDLSEWAGIVAGIIIVVRAVLAAWRWIYGHVEKAVKSRNELEALIHDQEDMKARMGRLEKGASRKARRRTR